MALASVIPPATTRLSLLSDGVLSIVLTCLFAPNEFRDTRRPLMKHRPAWPSWDAIQFASVCREWHALLHEVFTANALSLFSIPVTKLSRSSVMELRRQLTLRRAHTQRLNVERAPTYYLVEGFVHHFNGVALWASLLCHAPQTTAVDLTADDDTLRTYPIQFLLAAAHSLPRVHSLHVPQYQFGPRYTDPMEIMMDALMRALEVWHTRGQQGRLRVVQLIPGTGAQPMQESLTDRSLKSLSKLLRLEFVELNAKNITGDGIFALVFKSLPQSTWAMHEYRVRVSEDHPVTATRPLSPIGPFYSIVLGLLEHLAAADDSTAISSRPVVLWLVNNSEKTAGEAWYEEYLGQVTTS